MARRTRRGSTNKQTADIRHVSDKRRNLPSAQDATMMTRAEREPTPYYLDRDPDLDPQLVWRGKSTERLEVMAPPIFVQERIRPKALIDDLRRHSDANPSASDADDQARLFADFNGLPSADARTEFYQHDANWSNRMILGDSLQVMASLAEKEGLKGKVQCVYVDPPYGINFSSNWQYATDSRVVRNDAKSITHEPEQIKAFRDAWTDGVNSYLTYLRDRLLIARDLLHESGSIFVQIGDENIHRVRALLDEVFGDENFVSLITFTKTGALPSGGISSVCDYLVWFAKSSSEMKYRDAVDVKSLGGEGATGYTNAISSDLVERRSLTPEEIDNPGLIPDGYRPYHLGPLISSGPPGPNSLRDYQFQGVVYQERGARHWKTTEAGMNSLAKAGRLAATGNTLKFLRFFDDVRTRPIANNWTDTKGNPDMRYVVETSRKVIQRCILMTTDPGDLVLDPTCGGGTTAYVAEQWGRRWITIDTSRVALAITRARVMGARYDYYLLADSADGAAAEAQLPGKSEQRSTPPHADSARNGAAHDGYRHDVRQGFVYERVPHITLASIANNTAIDDIWQQYQTDLEPLRTRLNELCGTSFEEWEVPREPDADWPKAARRAHDEWWQLRIARQRDIDASIAANADFEYLYDKPRIDRGKVRVAGPFTVESVSPHRMLAVDGPTDEVVSVKDDAETETDYVGTILDNLKASGVQQANQRDWLKFSSIEPWPGAGVIAAIGHYTMGSADGGGDSNGDDSANGAGEMRQAAIYIGPEFASVTRPDIVEAARAAAEAGFEMLVCCGFQYDAQTTGKKTEKATGETTEITRHGSVQVLQARMNADLHMASDLRTDSRANLFVVFGEPDIDILAAPDDGDDQIVVRINGVDVYDPTRGEVRSHGTDGIAMWFIDTNYDEECFFVRHAYFLGASDPYKNLRTTLKGEINAEAWDTLHSAESRPFAKPQTGRIAVKVINRLGDEVMKVFRVG